MKKYLPFAALPLILAVSLWLWSNLPEQRFSIAYSHNAVWDLSDFDFADVTASIHGRVEFLPGQFITPDEFTARENDVSLEYPHIGEGTVRMRFIVPTDEYYMFTRIGTGYADRIYVNGYWLTDIGIFETRSGLLSPVLAFAARPTDGIIEILHGQSNFVYNVHGVYQPGALDELIFSNALHRGNYVTNIILGILLALALASLLLYLLLFQYRPVILFALLCVFWIMRTGSSSQMVFLSIMPWLTDPLRYSFVAIIGPVTTVLMVVISYDMFPGMINKHFVRITAVLYPAVVAYLIFISDMGTILNRDLWIALGLAIAGTLVALLSVGLKLKKARTPQKVFIVGTIIIAYAGIRDMLMNFNANIEGFNLMLPPFGGAILAPVGVIAFLTCVAAAIFMETMQEIENSKEAERRLSTENAALDNMYRMRTEFLTNISHEMKTPLTIMSGYAELAGWQMDENTDAGEIKEGLNTISDEAHRLSQMVEQLLDVYGKSDNKMISVKTSAADILSQVSNLCRPILSTNKNKLAVSVEENCPPIGVSPDIILQILVNLVSNANRHTMDGLISINVRRIDDKVSFQVSDIGSGIPPDVLRNVFKRGVSGIGSTGLGLSICKDAVESHGGMIEVESKLGEGTSVTFTLPIHTKLED